MTTISCSTTIHSFPRFRCAPERMGEGRGTARAKKYVLSQSWSGYAGVVLVVSKFAFRPIVLALCTWLLASGPAVAQGGGTPPAPQTSAPAAPLALGTPHDMGMSTPLRFTLERLTYALGWTHHYRSVATVADNTQKIVVIHFKLENAGNADLPFRDSTLKYQAIDEQGIVHERTTHMHVRAAGLTTAAEGGVQRVEGTVLKPGQPVALYTAIVVPKRQRITRFAVATRERNAQELVFDVSGKITPLPAGFHDGSPELVREVIDAAPGQFLAGTSLDIQIDRMETTTDADRGSRRLRDGTQWVLVGMTIRNRSIDNQSISVGNFRETRLVDSAGELHAPVLTLHPTRHEQWRPVIEPGKTGSFIVSFAIPATASPDRLRLRVIGNEGRISHLYSVPFGGGPQLAAAGPPVAAGVFFPGRYALMAPTPIVQTPSIVMSTGAAGPAPGNSGKPASAPSSPGDPAPAPTVAGPAPTAPAMKPLRRTGFTLNSIGANSPTESEGDEPYLVVWAFSGSLRPDDRLVTALESTIVTLGANDFLKGGDIPFRPQSSAFSSRFPVSFYNVKPYEFYLMAVAVIEADGSSHTDRRKFADQFARSISARVATLVAASRAVDTTDARAATQEAYLARLGTFVGQLRNMNIKGIFDNTLKSLVGNDDDYIGTRFYVGVNLPSVSAAHWAANQSLKIESRAGVIRENLSTQSATVASVGNYYDLYYQHFVEP